MIMVDAAILVGCRLCMNYYCTHSVAYVECLGKKPHSALHCLLLYTAIRRFITTEDC
jgi:hypothetical protein